MIRKVAVIMGSDSDWPVVKGACAQLKALDIPFEAHILSAHRTSSLNSFNISFGYVILYAKGPAVKSLRAQADKITYPKEMLKLLREEPNLTIKEAMVENCRRRIRCHRIRHGRRHTSERQSRRDTAFLP